MPVIVQHIRKGNAKQVRCFPRQRICLISEDIRLLRQTTGGGFPEILQAEGGEHFRRKNKGSIFWRTVLPDVFEYLV